MSAVPKSLNVRVTPETHGLLDHLVSKHPLTKHAIAKRAMDLGLSVLLQNQARWLANGGDGCTNSYVPRYEANPVHHTYLIHHNGGRPWQVKVSRVGVEIYGYSEFKGSQTHYDVQTYEVAQHEGHWWGFDTSGAFRHGNTVLVKITDRKYLYIAGDIYVFETPDDILEYVSPLGNSNVPYPVAWSESNVYFLVGPAMVERRDLKTRATLWNAEKLYSEFYGHKGLKHPKRVPMRIVRSVACGGVVAP